MSLAIERGNSGPLWEGIGVTLRRNRDVSVSSYRLPNSSSFFQAARPPIHRFLWLSERLADRGPAFRRLRALRRKSMASCRSSSRTSRRWGGSQHKHQSDLLEAVFGNERYLGRSDRFARTFGLRHRRKPECRLPTG